MPIQPERIQGDIDAIARFSESASGTDRPTFSAAWRQAWDYVAQEAQRAGCEVRVDAFGNLHARPAKLGWDQPAWLCGSHVDSVPNGGNFDGVAGVVVALEILRAAHEDKINVPLELIVFAEEEGTTFGLGMIGSRLWTGDTSAALEPYVRAGAAHGVRAERFDAERFDPSRYLGMIELHIEQGPGLWKAGIPLGIVTAIAGRRQYRASLRGVANHAGSTAMRDRRDALVGAAVAILQLEGLANGLAQDTVITVGRIACSPNAINVVPELAEFTIDFRSPSRKVLTDGDEKIRHVIEQVCSRRALEGHIEMTESIAPVEMDLHLCGRLRSAAEALKIQTRQTISGALHDAAILAPHLPTAMLFVPSRDGLSHNPAEFSRVEDIAQGARVIEQVVRNA